MTLSSFPAQQQRALARWLRRSPRVRTAVSEVVRRLRRSPTLTDLVWRVFLPSSSLGVKPVAVHGGHHLHGRDLAFLPVVGVLALGLSDQEAEQLIERVAELQREQQSFRPLLVLDRPVLAAARRHGYVLELITPQDRWAGPPGGSDDRSQWVDHVGRHLAGIVEHYQLFHLARATADGIDPLDVALVRNLRARLPDALDVRLTGR